VRTFGLQKSRLLPVLRNFSFECFAKSEVTLEKRPVRQVTDLCVFFSVDIYKP